MQERLLELAGICSGNPNWGGSTTEGGNIKTGVSLPLVSLPPTQFIRHFLLQLNQYFKSLPNQADSRAGSPGLQQRNPGDGSSPTSCYTHILPSSLWSPVSPAHFSCSPSPRLCPCWVPCTADFLGPLWILNPPSGTDLGALRAACHLVPILRVDP